jgi:hypothetical protein
MITGHGLHPTQPSLRVWICCGAQLIPSPRLPFGGQESQMSEFHESYLVRTYHRHFGCMGNLEAWEWVRVWWSRTLCSNAPTNSD